MLRGTCFTLSFPDKILAMEMAAFVIKRSCDISIYLHNEGEEFWFLFYDFPIEMAYLRIDVNSR